MALGHITVDIDDGLKDLLLQLWTHRRLELGDLTLQLQGDLTTIRWSPTDIIFDPPLAVSGRVLGRVRAGTTVTRITCQPDKHTITVDLNYSPIDVRIQ